MENKISKEVKNLIDLTHLAEKETDKEKKEQTVAQIIKLIYG